MVVEHERMELVCQMAGYIRQQLLWLRNENFHVFVIISFSLSFDSSVAQHCDCVRLAASKPFGRIENNYMGLSVRFEIEACRMSIHVFSVCIRFKKKFRASLSTCMDTPRTF